MAYKKKKRLQEGKMLVEKVKRFPIFYDKKVQGFGVQNGWEKVAESLDFAENCNFIGACSVSEIHKILVNEFNLCRCYFGFR